MRLPTKQRYAVRIATYIGCQNGTRPARKKEIAAAEDIPADYIEQICVRLKAGGIVESHRGKNGGFSLARDAAKITVADVMRAMDGRGALVPCLDGYCKRTAICATKRVWERADAALNDVLAGVTIAELVKESKKLTDSGAVSFDI